MSKFKDFLKEQLINESEFKNSFTLGMNALTKFKKNHKDITWENDHDEKIITGYKNKIHVITFNYDKGEIYTNFKLSEFK